ncbi:MAG TPA: 50S ribosomal protein L9 [Bryobacteraceae bacterium]|nr:50S ribosomal protein L9 [Bryobacteraceae bacterium]
MEVILREDVEKLGARGQMVKVTPGYARNFLLPKKLAVIATDSNRKIVEQERQAALRRDAKEQSDAGELAKIMSGLTVTFVQKAGENDQLFGSVTAKDIADALEAQKYTVDRRKILLDDPIKTLGEHKVTIRLHRDVNTEINVHVKKEDAAAKPAAKEDAAAKPAAKEE